MRHLPAPTPASFRCKVVGNLPHAVEVCVIYVGYGPEACGEMHAQKSHVTLPTGSTLYNAVSVHMCQSHMRPPVRLPMAPLKLPSMPAAPLPPAASACSISSRA